MLLSMEGAGTERETLKSVQRREQLAGGGVRVGWWAREGSPYTYALLFFGFYFC